MKKAAESHENDVNTSSKQDGALGGTDHPRRKYEKTTETEENVQEEVDGEEKNDVPHVVNVDVGVGRGAD